MNFSELGAEPIGIVASMATKAAPIVGQFSAPAAATAAAAAAAISYPLVKTTICFQMLINSHYCGHNVCKR
jgi:hypothetical protein